MSMKAIDDLLIKVQNNEPVEPLTEPKLSETESESPKLSDKEGESEANEGQNEEKLNQLEQFRKDKEEFLSKKEDTQRENDAIDNADDKKSDELSLDTDDYG